MKRSPAVPLSLVAALAGACTPSAPPVDPCVPASYDRVACEYAVDHQGYYYHSHWYAHVYDHPFLWYDQSYGTYVARGGSWRPVGSGAYAPASAAAAPSRSGVVRGGFGSTGEAHAGTAHAGE